MPQWNYEPYRGPNAQLLQDIVNVPSKNAAGLNALSEGLFGGVNNAIGLIPQMIQNQRMKQLIGKMMQGQNLLSRSQQPFNGMDQSKLLNVYRQVDPQGAQQLISNMIQQRLGAGNQSQAYINDQGQFSATPQEGYQPYGMVDRGELMRSLATQAEKGQALKEKQQEAEFKRSEMESNRKLKELQSQMNVMLAQGRLEEARARAQAIHDALVQRAQEAQYNRQLKAAMENAKYPLRNAFRSFMGKGPVIPVPGQSDASQLSDDELKRIINGQ